MISVEHVTKYFGPFPAVTDVSFEVQQGEVLGLLGPNGAGKSTTMKMVVGFMPPTSGRVTVAGHDVVGDSLEARRCIGYLPENVPLYSDMTVKEYLGYMGRLRGMSSRRVRERTAEVVDVCRLGSYYDVHISKLSKGFRQRVGIAQAVLHEPQVLILDEPTIGIDPNQVVETRELIRSLGGGHTVVVSTHVLSEVSLMCQRAVIIHEGQVVAQDTLENLETRLQGRSVIELDVDGPREQVMRAIDGVDGVQEVEAVHAGLPVGCRYAVYVEEGSDPRGLLAAAVVRRGWSLLRLDAAPASLEQVFQQLTTDEEGGGQ